MAARVSFAAVYEPVEHGRGRARLAALHGVRTAAPTPEEASALRADALQEDLLALG